VFDVVISCVIVDVVVVVGVGVGVVCDSEVQIL